MNNNLLKKLICLIFILCCSGCSDNTQNAELPSNEDQVTVKYNKWLELKEKAIPELKKALTDNNFRMRSHAVLAMGKTGDRSLIPTITDVLQNDTDRPVKNCAVIALGTLNATEAVPILIRYITVENMKKQGVSIELIVESLGLIRDTKALEPLFSLLFSDQVYLRLKIIEAFINIGSPDISGLFLKNIDKIQENGLCKEAATIFAVFPTHGVEEWLFKWFESDNMTYKISSAYALGKIKSQKAIPILINALNPIKSNSKEPSNNEHLEKTLADAIATIDSLNAVEPLCDLLKNPNRSYIAAEILSRMTADQIPEIIFSIFEQNPSLNAPCAYILGVKKYSKALPTIKKRLKDISQSGQNEMASSLGWMNDLDSIPLLMEIAQRKAEQGASGAVQSLGNLKATQALPLLLGLLKQKDITVQVILALGQIKDQTAAKPLIDLYYETGQKYSIFIGNALVDIGGKDVIAFVKNDIECNDIERQRFAGYILTRLKDENTKNAVPKN